MIIGPNNVILFPFSFNSTDSVTIAKKNIISVENYHTPVTSDVLGELWILVTLPKIVWLTLQNILQLNQDETRLYFLSSFECTQEIIRACQENLERSSWKESTSDSGLRATSWNLIHAHGLYYIFIGYLKLFLKHIAIFWFFLNPWTISSVNWCQNQNQ